MHLPCQEVGVSVSGGRVMVYGELRQDFGATKIRCRTKSRCSVTEIRCSFGVSTETYLFGRSGHPKQSPLSGLSPLAVERPAECENVAVARFWHSNRIALEAINELQRTRPQMCWTVRFLNRDGGRYSTVDAAGEKGCTGRHSRKIY